MLPTIFVYKPFSQNKFFQVCLLCLAVLLLLFCYFSTLAASSNFRAVNIVYRFFLPVGFVHDSDYFPLQSFNIKRSVQFSSHQKSYHWSCQQQIFVICCHFTQFDGKDNAHVRYLAVSCLLLLVAQYAIHRY